MDLASPIPLRLHCSLAWSLGFRLICQSPLSPLRCANWGLNRDEKGLTHTRNGSVQVIVGGGTLKSIIPLLTQITVRS